MDFIKGNQAFELLHTISNNKRKMELLKTTKWGDIAKVVLSADHKLLHKICSEINPEYRTKLLEKPLYNKQSAYKLQQTERKDSISKKNKVKKLLEQPAKTPHLGGTTIASILKTALFSKVNTIEQKKSK